MAKRRPKRKAKRASRKKRRARKKKRVKRARKRRVKRARRRVKRARKRRIKRARKKKKARKSRKKARKARKKKTARAKASSSPKPISVVPTLELEKYERQGKEEEGVVATIKGSVNYAWIGTGQCGGRLTKSFYDLGYKKVVALNTTHHDLDLLDLPKNQKFLMDIGEKGAGKDMKRGEEAAQRYQQEILHMARRVFASNVDHIMVCFGAGGGTGSGSVTSLIEVAKKYARHIGIEDPNKHVGVLMTLPTIGEAASPAIARNAYDIASELGRMAASGKISPLIIIDNEKINKMYPGLTVKSFWPTINSTVSGLFDIFNRLSALSSRYTSFDPVDYHSIMQAGGCAIMGLTKVSEFKDKFGLSAAVKQNLERTLLANGFDLSSAKVAGSVVVGGSGVMANVKGLQENINYAFDILSEITGKATLHRGIYEDSKDSVRVYTIIGGLDSPTRRLSDLKGVSK